MFSYRCPQICGQRFEIDKENFTILGVAFPDIDTFKNSTTLLDIHKHLFQDIYSWAEQPRMVEISKGGRHYVTPQAHLFLNNGAHLPHSFEKSGGKITLD
jgi:hypothetical protein